MALPTWLASRSAPLSGSDPSSRKRYVAVTESSTRNDEPDRSITFFQFKSSSSKLHGSLVI
jgi:hypothetical protein